MVYERAEEIFHLLNTMPDVDLVYTDEGDWSVSFVCGSNTYVITPVDPCVSRFVVERCGPDGSIELLSGPKPIKEALKYA